MRNTFDKYFVDPISYQDTPENRKRVIDYIKLEVKETYSSIGLGDPMTLRMMEKKNLEAFKALIEVKNKVLLKSVIKEYSDIGFYDYSSYLMMYNAQLDALNTNLSW